MRIIRDLSTVSAREKNAVIALGNFDGVHLGHQAILQQAAKIAAEKKAPLAAMTFEPHPREFLSEGREKLRIYPFHTKAELFAEAGVETLFALRFNRRFSNTSAADFVQKILHDALAVKHVVTGYNFFFGHQRKGNKDFLAQEALRLHFGFTAHEPISDGEGNLVSSSRIRALLKEGDVRTASIQLGRPYRISGRVRHGENRGKNLGYPTANIVPAGLFLPRFGIYAVRVTLSNGAEVDGVASLGVKPTFGEFAPALETYLFNFTRELYGERMTVELVEFLRDEKKFDGEEALKAEIANDVVCARHILAHERKPE